MDVGACTIARAAAPLLPWLPKRSEAAAAAQIELYGAGHPGQPKDMQRKKAAVPLLLAAVQVAGACLAAPAAADPTCHVEFPAGGADSVIHEAGAVVKAAVVGGDSAWSCLVRHRWRWCVGLHVSPGVSSGGTRG